MSLIVETKMDHPDLKWYVAKVHEAHFHAKMSKDPSTKVGAVLMRMRDPLSGERELVPVNNGFNGFPRKVRDDIPERWERPLKYQLVVHAEMNAILNAAREGFATKGATLFVTHVPCDNCAKGIAQAGIVEVVFDRASIQNPLFFSRWKESAAIALLIFEEARVSLKSLDLQTGELFEVSRVADEDAA